MNFISRLLNKQVSEFLEDEFFLSVYEFQVEVDKIKKVRKEYQEELEQLKKVNEYLEGYEPKKERM